MSSVMKKAKAAKSAKEQLALLSREEKDDALEAMATALTKEASWILAENEKDMQAGRENGLSEALLDRLALTKERIHSIAEGVREVKKLPDPIGDTVRTWERPNGIQIEEVRVPLGVIGMIYEARPNVTADASALCLKSGNPVLLRGSSSAFQTNKAIVDVLHRALDETKLPSLALQLVEDTSREAAHEMLHLTEDLDVIIPRGGASLIQHVVKNASVPVLETGVGNCHVYIDESADDRMGVQIAVNAKTDRPSVCNACETVLIHRDWADQYAASLVEELKAKGVAIRGDDYMQAHFDGITPAETNDWHEEYLNLTVAIRTVPSLNDAIRHIQTYGTGHSEAIVTEETGAADEFMARIDAAALYHNASTRFTDGNEFGFGAEIGISTQKMHVRGPMGLEALTASKYLVRGNGQIKE
ncbi:glutamate-5-semialdehyde dehydrogenase [Salsuginibacillus halophilus]|uniref:Gamma-glutamyl phosphate reductase n=1 Tax=Salsuginibacillus halophilus TaxID=517424 RepID=A0A2P8HX68_9BACI|nr:glutamate-5-semialdehyde dehydrogenase [Salsuginibacillus halophilus]PSL50798.1 glutamate-5-semialdehyde dehydrogenase [Salsuginibacillus halophilus]